MSRRWTREFVRNRFPERVREQRRAEGRDPDIKPTHEWLSEHGFMGIRGYADRRDKTVDEVLIEEAGFEKRERHPLPGSHGETIQLVKQWLNDEAQTFHRVQDVETIRSEISRVMEFANASLGSVNLLRFGRQEKQVAVRDTVKLFDRLNRELESEGARYNYASTLVSFLDYLELLDRIDGHPVEEVLARQSWTYDRTHDGRVLKPDQVVSCWRAAEAPEEHVLVVLLSFAGIRPSDVTLVYEEDVYLDPADPRIEFGKQRKNGRGEAAIMAGTEILEEYLDHLDRERDDWDGALFPSDLSADGTRSVGWVGNRVEDLTQRAGVTLQDGSRPTAKHFRRFWFEAFSEALSHFVDRVDIIGDLQGSTDPHIVRKHYLPNRQRRDHFRQYAENYFEAATPDDEFVPPDDVFDAREPEVDPQASLEAFHSD